MSSSMRGTHSDAVTGEGEKVERNYDSRLYDENEDDSAEDTEEASENELGSSMNQHTMDERMEIKEQMYQDKLANLKHQMELLRQHKHPEYLRRVEKLQEELEDRLLLNDLYRDYLLSCVDRDYELEIEAAEKEFEEKAAELKENLISDLEDRKKMIEHEFATMELSGDSIDVKPTVTRKLRRRPNEPLPVPEKRRKPTTSQLVFLLDEKEIEHDLKLVSRGKSSSGRSQQQHAINGATSSSGSASGAGSSGITASSIAHNSGGDSSGAGYSGGQPCSDQNEGSKYDKYGSGSQTNQSNNMQQHNAQQTSSATQQQQQPLSETRIEDGKLWYERRWFHRGQPVYVEGKDISRFSGNISAIGVEAICVKKTADGQKVRIFLSHLRRGKVTIKRRAN